MQNSLRKCVGVHDDDHKHDEEAKDYFAHSANP